MPRRIRLSACVNKPADSTEGQHDHHAAPDQVREDVAIGAVEHQQRKTERRRKPCPAAAEGALLRTGQRGLQDPQEDHADDPAELRHIENSRRGIEQQQVQRPVEGAQRKAAVKAEQQQKMRLPEAFPVVNTRKHRA